MSMRRAVFRLLSLPVVAAMCLGPVGAIAGAPAEDGLRPYRPLTAEVGAALTPPADLLDAAKQLRAATIAKDTRAVFAMMGDKVTIISSGLTPAARRDAERKGPWSHAEAALAEIGGYFMEGDLPVGGTVDPAARITQVLEMIADATEQPEWGRDPLVKGGFCTYRGVRWDAGAGATIDSGSRGIYVPAPTPVRDSAAAKAAVIGTLKPGHIYLQDELDGLPDGWRGVRLPSGRVGAVRDAQVRDPAVWGLCFLRNAKGGWSIAAFSSALL
ncbi:hypothetical protein [Xanthobacter versatilis]|uniref:hypothetical protein n=1 Tax=Xanthobacter autotrophicus (strain ATCC BAA-1158 / Py2) TaxID=78245 RepID=UPI00372816A7